MPIDTTRLLIRPKQVGDGAENAVAVAETWDDLNRWMMWAQRLETLTAEQQEINTRRQRASFLLREEVNLVGIERSTGQPVIWCKYHDIDWSSRQCATGFWVRKSAQGRGFATEATNAPLRYAFGPLAMQRVWITHSDGNDASRRIVEKLRFLPEGVQKGANLLPSGHTANRYLYARFDINNLPPLDVRWG